MARSIADLRAGRAPSLPTRVVKVCLDQEVTAQIQRLTAEREDILFAARRASVDADAAAPPKKASEKATPPRVAEIDAEIEVAWDRIRDAEGELLLRAVTGGEWLRWKDEHPARKDNQVDDRVTFGFCNAVDLMDELARFAVEWNGEALAEGDWDLLAAEIAPADMTDLVRAVVEMHESRVVAPKVTALSETHSPGDSAS